MFRILCVTASSYAFSGSKRRKPSHRSVFIESLIRVSSSSAEVLNELPIMCMLELVTRAASRLRSIARTALTENCRDVDGALQATTHFSPQRSLLTP